MALVSFARRLSDLAADNPDFPAVTCGGRSVSRSELERLGNRMARDLQARGVGVGDFVTVALPNSVDWFVAYLGCWKLGAVPQPVSAKLPARELAEIVALAESKVVVGAEPEQPPEHRLPAGRVPVAPRSRRWSDARRRVAGVEGADVGRLDRAAEADRLRRSVAHRRRGTVGARDSNATAAS